MRLLLRDSRHGVGRDSTAKTANLATAAVIAAAAKAAIIVEFFHPTSARLLRLGYSAVKYFINK